MKMTNEDAIVYMHYLKVLLQIHKLDEDVLNDAIDKALEELGYTERCL